MRLTTCVRHRQRRRRRISRLSGFFLFGKSLEDHFDRVLHGIYPLD
jgi:hypothetical protein